MSLLMKIAFFNLMHDLKVYSPLNFQRLTKHDQLTHIESRCFLAWLVVPTKNLVESLTEFDLHDFISFPHGFLGCTDLSSANQVLPNVPHNPISQFCLNRTTPAAFKSQKELEYLQKSGQLVLFRSPHCFPLC